MWSTEHAVEGEASAEAIWSIWADVENWGEWNPDIEAIEIDAPFAVGSTIVMTPRGADPVTLRVTEARPGEVFVDEADLGDAVARTEHRIERVDGDRVRVTYRMEISGPAADRIGPEIGPAITADFPETIAALISLASD